MSSRLTAAREYVAKKPADRFGLYALAMELRKAKLWDECFPAFDALIAQHPDYGAGFYHYGAAKRESGDFEGARAILERGLEACNRSGDKHTFSEIQGAIEDIDLLS